MKTPAWYIEIQGMENKNILMHPYWNGIKNAKTSLWVLEWYQKNDNTKSNTGNPYLDRYIEVVQCK